VRHGPTASVLTSSSAGLGVASPPGVPAGSLQPGPGAGRGSRVVVDMGGFTKVHWHLALAYAEYLDARQHVLVHLAYNEQVGVERDTGLKPARAIAGYRRDGRDE